MRDIDRIRDALTAASARGESVVLATVMSVEGSVYRGAGARMIVCPGGTTLGAVSGGCLEADVVARAPDVLAGGVAELVRYDTRATDDVLLGLGMGCQGIIELLLEPLRGPPLAEAAEFYTRIARRRDAITLLTLVRSVHGQRIGSRLLVDAASHTLEGNVALLTLGQDVVREDIAPTIGLVICGGGTDAIPLARMARGMGWHVTVVDHRAAFATAERFPGIDGVVCLNLAHGDETLNARVPLDGRTMAVVMAHSAVHDRAYLHAMLDAGVAYIGVLGPRRRTLELLGAERPVDDVLVPPSVHSPAGLDLGAETPHEIALSIVAEIAAVNTGRTGGMLRERSGPIHDRRPIHVVAS
jgi:xanthine dehydrogenase accessory factor